MKMMLWIYMLLCLGLAGVSSEPSHPQSTALLWERDGQSTAEALYRVGMDGTRQTLLSYADGRQIEDFWMGRWVILAENGDDPQALDAWHPHPSPQAFRPPQPNAVIALQGDNPRVVGILHPRAPWSQHLLLSLAPDVPIITDLYAATSPDDPTPRRLTDVAQLFPEATPPLLSASAQFIAHRPTPPGILYRARAQDAVGNTHNGLFLHDLADRSTTPMPFFGQAPIWSADGMHLIGGRLDATAEGIPIYQLWKINIITQAASYIDNGCNPQLAPHGEWLAYDLHEDARWQSYVDCFANGAVAATHLPTGQRVILSDGLQGFVTLLGWVDPQNESAQ